MANTLKIKRGTAATIPQGQLAEPLFTTDTYDLYIGKGSGGNQRIQNYIASGTSSQFLKGDGSLDSTTYQATSEKGQNNGYASLDAGGKIPASQLPSSVIEYKGTWNASTNTPTLADGTGDAGDVYIVSVGGTQNLGSGSITFDAGDWVMYNGSVWQKSTGSNAVASVNGQTGIVSIGVNDLDDATITSVSNGQLLQYSTGTNKWVNWTPTYISAAITSLNGLTAATQTFANDTNVTITSATSTHTIGWSGQLSIARGGTGLSALGTAGQLLRVNSGATALEYFTPTYISAAITSLNGLTAATQTFAVGTSGTDFAISSSTSTHTFNLPTASATNRGALSSADWSTFNTKQNAITLTTTGSSGAATLVGATLNIPNYGSALSGYLPLTGGTLTGALIGTTASFTSNSGNFNLGSQADTAIYTHFGSKSASGGQAIAMRLAGTLTATANFDNLFGLWVDYTDNTAGYAGVTRYGIYQNDSAKRNYFGGLTTFNSAVTGSDTITATAFIPSGTSVPSRGIYTSASNVLDFSAGTTNLLSLNYNTGLSTFNTGVRGYYFRIVNVSTAEFGINTENNQGYIGTTTSHGFNIMTNNTPRLTISSTGAATFSSSVTATQFIQTSDNSTELKIGRYNSTYQNAYIDAYHSSGSVGMHLRTQDAGSLYSRIVITSTGNVGIGSTDPSTWIDGSIGLSIYQSTTGRATLSLAGTNTSADEVLGRVLFTNTATTNTVKRLVMIDGVRGADANSGYLSFSTANSGNPTERMRITSGGNVGIGTTPSVKLHVYGVNEIFRLETTAATGSNYFLFRSPSADMGYIGYGASGNNNITLINYLNADMTFGTNSAERMRITSGGNVTIGYTTGYSNVRLNARGANTSSSDWAFFAENSSGGTIIGARNDSQVYAGGIGSATGTTLVLDSSGYIKTSSSSIRYKKDIKPIDIGLNFILGLNPVSYLLKEGDIPQVGFIAEDFPDERLVSMSMVKPIDQSSGYQKEGVNYAQIVAPLVKAIQEQQAQIEELKSKLN